VLFLSTPFDLPSAEALRDLVAAYKVASSDNTFVPLLETVAAAGKPVLISTGLATLDEVAAARAVIRRVWCEHGFDRQLALLHCVSSYPTPPQQANLAAIRTLADRFGDTVGYSDHTLGIEAAVGAVAVGARIVEKHFTLDKEQSDFRDHQLSADPPELAELVRRIRQVEAMLGDGVKAPQACERDAVAALRRVPVARRDLVAGTVLGPQDIVWLRRGGSRAQAAEHPVGGRLATPLAAGDVITPEALAARAPQMAGRP
jgi:N,N'-diacetyllegionaminate synthase